ncbi:histidine kinase [Spirosoma sp. BT702]|uniref:Histidine kinase n=1 Tax=Spirosoma profusum TaxID=2771354 RepID=A0A926Y180_9BACT|nr:sensor histidine kinase [Spirosoma profusum]MBD2704602.1 histidine kinase [Spirosoma profusum]
MLFTYPLAYGLLPLLFRRRLGLFVVGVLLLYTFSWFQFDASIYLLQYALTQWFSYTPNYQVDTWFFSTNFPGDFFVLTVFGAGLFIGLKLYGEWEKKQTEAQQLEREKLTQELDLLKLQINPHLLFGTLTVLYQLTNQRSKQAPQVALNLAHFLRYVLYESRAENLPLSHEIDLINQYIFLQQTLYSDTLNISFTARGSIDLWRIEPLLFFSIIEKIIQQVVGEQSHEQLPQTTWVSIDLLAENSQLILKVVSELHQPNQETDRSIKLNELKKQLNLYYPEKHRLAIWQENQIQVITLTLSKSVSDPMPSAIGMNRIRNEN